MQGEEAPPGASVTRALSSLRRHPLLMAGPPAALTWKEVPTPPFLPSPPSWASNVKCRFSWSDGEFSTNAEYYLVNMTRIDSDFTR